jgi:microcystin-dependent protein
MAQPYVGEIRMFGGNFAPAGWMFCDGQLLPISENETLFQLIGTTYGGDGESTFALPNLQGRIPIHLGTGSSGTTYQLAESGGVEAVTLTVNQIPAHSHPFLASGDTGNQVNPANNLPSNSQGAIPYIEDAPTLNMNVQIISSVGGSQPHTNFQPYLCINFIISLFGIFPSQT